MQVGGLDKRPQPRGDIRGRRGIRGSRHSQGRAELHAADAYAGRFESDRARHRGLRIPRRNDSNRNRRGCARGRRRAPRSALMPSRAASQSAPCWNSQRSKNSIVSVVFSSRQSGSGSMSRCSNWPLSRRMRTSVSATRAMLVVIVAQSCSRASGHPGLVRERRGGDAAIDVIRHEPPQNLDQVQRVLHPRVVAPVRRVDVRLYRRAVKGAVRKAVDDGDVETFAVEKRSEVGETVAVQQLARFSRLTGAGPARTDRTATGAPSERGAMRRMFSKTAGHPSAGWMFVQ